MCRCSQLQSRNRVDHAPVGRRGLLPDLVPDIAARPCRRAYLTLGLLGETLLRMAWLRAAFWAAWGNVVDCTVSGLSLLSFVLYVRQTSQDLELVVLVLMICWLLLRIVRLYTVAKNLATSHRRRSTKSEIRFDFGDNDADESAPV